MQHVCVFVCVCAFTNLYIKDRFDVCFDFQVVNVAVCRNFFVWLYN